MICKNCDKEINENLKFCTYCGTKIGDSHQNHIIIILSAVFLSILILCGLVYEYVQNNAKNSINIEIYTNNQIEQYKSIKSSA